MFWSVNAYFVPSIVDTNKDSWIEPILGGMGKLLVSF